MQFASSTIRLLYVSINTIYFSLFPCQFTYSMCHSMSVLQDFMLCANVETDTISTIFFISHTMD